jgi:hypothetical protein
MLYRLVRPVRRSGSRIPYFVQRIPADVKARAIGLKLDLPIGDETVPVTVTAKTSMVKVSLRTPNPTEAKVRQATLAAHLETTWRALRDDSPITLTHRQATALAGRLYRAWAYGEGRERTTSVTIDRLSGEWKADYASADNVPDFWEVAKEHLDKVEEADEEFQAKDAENRRQDLPRAGGPDRRRPLERAFGPLIDRLLLREGSHRRTACAPSSRGFARCPMSRLP